MHLVDEPKSTLASEGATLFPRTVVAMICIFRHSLNEGICKVFFPPPIWAFLGGRGGGEEGRNRTRMPRTRIWHQTLNIRLQPKNIAHAKDQKFINIHQNSSTCANQQYAGEG